MNIRCATELDAYAIANIHVLSWQAIYKGLMPDHVLDNLDVEKRFNEWRKRLFEGVDVWVAEDGNNCIGFISICPSRDNDHDPNNVAEISAIYLLPEYWGKGLGKQLCQNAFDHVIRNGFKEITLWVLNSNKQACSFYESLGFCATGDMKTDHVGCEKLTVIRYIKYLEKLS